MGPVVLAMKALGFGVALMLVATVVSAQDQRPPAPDAFRVSWQRETDPVARRIEGRVHNDPSGSPTCALKFRGSTPTAGS